MWQHLSQSALSLVPLLHEFALPMKLMITVHWTMNSSAGRSMLSTADAVHDDDPGGDDIVEGFYKG